jgi:hypothetical protein
MAPLVRKPRGKPLSSDGTRQHWGMLVFESLSAGAMALLLAIAAVMAIVGVYVILIWPLTLWDLSFPGMEKLGSWANIAMWTVFVSGSLVGLWAFSGLAFRQKK